MPKRRRVRAAARTGGALSQPRLVRIDAGGSSARIGPIEFPQPPLHLAQLATLGPIRSGVIHAVSPSTDSGHARRM